MVDMSTAALKNGQNNLPDVPSSLSIPTEKILARSNGTAMDPSTKNTTASSAMSFLNGKQQKHQNKNFPLLQSYLKKTISAEKTPYLAQYAPEKAHAAILNGDDCPPIHKGKMLSEGEFSQTFHVTKIGGQTTTTTTTTTSSEKYCIQCLHPKVDEQPSIQVFEKAVTHLVMEALYLATLNHEFILKLHGFSLGEEQHMDSVFLLTAGISETLEHRMEHWKETRRKLELSKSKRRLLLESLEMDISSKTTTTTTQQKPSSKKHTTTADTSLHVHPEKEEPPDDLVALQTNYALQIALGLEYLHHRGIVLRDLRPNTIGFKAYPEHHTIQLLEIGSCCRELPVAVDGASSLIPSEDMNSSQDKMKPGLLKGQSTHSISSANDSSASTDKNDHHLNNSSNNLLNNNLDSTSRHTNNSSTTVSRSIMNTRSFSFRALPNLSRHGKIKIPEENAALRRANPKHYRAPETYANIHPSSLTDETSSLPFETSSNKKYTYEGYNTKADMFSWSMIYLEMLIESRPYSQRTLEKESHYYKIQSLGQRPNLNKYHFPRTIKVILEQSWNPAVSKRATAQEVCQRLGIVLNMLEGKGLPWNATPATATATATAGPDATATASLSATVNRHEGDLSVVPQLPQEEAILSLPDRASFLMLHPSRSTKGWSTVWNEEAQAQKVDPKTVVDALMAHKAKQKKAKAKSGKQETWMKKVASLRKLIPFDLNKGMVRSESNEATAKRLLGPDYKKKYLK